MALNMENLFTLLMNRISFLRILDRSALLPAGLAFRRTVRSSYRLVTVELSCCLKLAPFFSGCFKQLLFEQFDPLAQSMLFSLLLVSLFAFSIVAAAPASAAAC